MLQQPYPLTERSTFGILATGLMAGVLVAFVIIVFQPFGTSNIRFPNKNFFLAGYGLITAMVVWLMAFAPRQFVKAESWTVWKQIVAVLIALFLGITASYFYLLLLGGYPEWRAYGFFVGNAMTIGVFPVIGITIMDYFLKFRKYDQGAKRFNSTNAEPVPVSREEPGRFPAPAVVVRDDQGRAVLTLPTDRIWCLRSDRNYVDVFHLDKEGKQKKTTVRNTLSALMESLPESFLHCHRSYVVHAVQVAGVAGNAQGYRLQNPTFPEVEVPVSRAKSAKILAKIKG